MLKNLKIGTKLIAAFTVILVGLLGIGAFGVYSLQTLASQDSAMYSENVVAVSAASSLCSEFYTLRSLAAETVSTNFNAEGANKLEEAMNNTSKNIDAIYAKNQTLMNAQGTESFAMLKSYFSAYYLFLQDLIKDIRNADRTKAGETLQTSAEQAINIAFYLKDVSDRNSDLAQKKAASSAGSSLTATYITIGIAGLVLIITVLLAFFVTRGITKPINKLMLASNKLAAGNTDIKLDIKSKDEIGQLAVSFGKMVGAIKALITDARSLSEQAVEGQLSMRADASRHQGSFRAVIDGINNTLDSIIMPFTEFKGILQLYCVNNFSSTVEGDYRGDIKEIADVINTLHTHLLRVKDTFTELANGDFTSLTDIEEKARERDNDELTPAVLKLMQNINALIDEANKLSGEVVQGNLDVRGESERFEGRYREIIDGINNIMDAMSTPLNETLDVLGTMALNDYTVQVSNDYHGSFAELSLSVNKVLATLNQVMNEINIAAGQVASGARQVSDGSQALSQGATEQASAIEELTTTVTEIASKTKQNAMSASEASQVASSVKENALAGNTRMQDMLRSMEEINEASANISKIIKVIDDIAFQTNILALNAAVEAARAGVHGKGFAVVAEEVRNLAAKSAEAARETTALIEGSIKKAETGTKIASETAEALGTITLDLEKAATLMSEIAFASNEQATGIAQVNKGIEQVAQVVQNNSATAEESAATTEELSSQAEVLKGMVGKFRLKTLGQKETTARDPEKSAEEKVPVPAGAAPGYGKY